MPLQATGMPGRYFSATILVSGSRRKSSLSNYQLFWKRWLEIYSFQRYICNFLADCLDEGHECWTISCISSEISAYHVHIDGEPAGPQSLVCSLMTGIFSSIPVLR